jgi:hypothetical protein
MRRSPEEEEIMFGKQLRLKRFFGGIVVTAAVGVVVVPAALSSTSARGGSAGSTPDVLARYVANHSGEAQQTQGYRFITDTLGGARQLAVVPQVQPNRFTSDPIAGNDESGLLSHFDNPNGYFPATVLGATRTAAPVETSSAGSTGTGSSSTWKYIAIVSLAAMALMLLLGAFRASRPDKPTVRTA